MKTNINTIIGTILSVLFTIGIIRIFQFEFYPWINVTIASGLPLTTFLISFLIYPKKIISSKLTYSILTLQFFGAVYFLSNPLLLKDYWDLLLIPTYIFVILLFLEIGIRKNKNIYAISKICFAIIGILILCKFVLTDNSINFIIACLTFSIAIILIFSKNKVVEKTK